MLDTCKILLINLIYTLFSIRNKLSAFSLDIPLTFCQTQPQFLLKIFLKVLEISNANNNPGEATVRRSIVLRKAVFFMCTFLFYQNVLIETTKRRCKVHLFIIPISSMSSPLERKKRKLRWCYSCVSFVKIRRRIHFHDCMAILFSYF